MSAYNENQPDGDWEDRGELVWTEADWRQFLKRQEHEIARFLKIYDACPASALERLDTVAREMGWEEDDWSVNEPFDDDDAMPANEREEFDSEPDPYTVHRHPVFMVSIGLLTQIRYIWRSLIHNQPESVDQLASWDFADSLTESERHALLGMQSMEMGDFLLCVIHFKRALRGIHYAMACLPRLRGHQPLPEEITYAFRNRLFDLREVFLRVIRDCRTEERM